LNDSAATGLELVVTTRRTDTLPFTSSNDIADPALLELEQSGIDYDENRYLVNRYFHRPAKNIDELCVGATSEEAYKSVLEQKRALWIVTQRFVTTESSLSVMPRVILRLAMSCLYMTITATFLNVGTITVNIVGLLLLFARYTRGLIGWLHSIAAADIRSYGRILEELRAKAKHEACKVDNNDINEVDATNHAGMRDREDGNIDSGEPST
jgi:hypothetical protein